MLKGVRHLSFEIGGKCNLAHKHEWCPAHDRIISRATLDPGTIARVTDEAVALGFDGYVGFHFYNEPCLYKDEIRAAIEACDYDRFMLWTNGTLLDQDFANLFEWIVVTDYGFVPDIMHKRMSVYPSSPDSRLKNYKAWTSDSATCWRHRVEVPIDHDGGVHLCCQDWKNTLGNIFDSSLEHILQPYLPMMLSLCSDGQDVFDVCKTCHNRIDFDSYTRGRA